MTEKMIELLYLSLEEELSAEDQMTLDKALNASEELRNEKELLLNNRALLADYSPQFENGFAEKVIKNLPKENNQGVVIKLYRAIAYSGVAAVMLLLIMNYNSGGGFSLEGFLGLDQVSNDITTLTVFGH